jgi:hypothetical protein
MSGVEELVVRRRLQRCAHLAFENRASPAFEPLVAEGEMRTLGVDVAVVTNAVVLLLWALPAFAQHLEGLDEVLVPGK